MNLRTEDIKNLTRSELETLAGGVTGYPPARASAAKAEILRRDWEHAETRQESRQGDVLMRKPSLWGIGIDLKALIRRLRAWVRI